jgi:glycerol-3-phosphate acyltransferase PlsX
MGAALVTMRQGIARPRVGLLSNGTEATRGNELVLEAHQLLADRAAQSFGLEFVGNLEGTQVATGAADVIVADGFTGNITLKLIEGISQRLMTVIRDRATSSTRGKVGGIMLRPSLRGLRDELDPEGPGGAYLLGLRKLGVIPHGRFTRVGFANAIRAAAQGVDEDVVGRTIAAMEAAGALRRPPSDSPATVLGQ